MRQSKKIILFFLVILATFLTHKNVESTRKIRYKKAPNYGHGNVKKSASFLTDEDEVFGFLSRIRPNQVYDLTPLGIGLLPEYDDEYVYTTSSTTTTTTTTTTPSRRTMDSYCLKPTGMFAYDPGTKNVHINVSDMQHSS